MLREIVIALVLVGVTFAQDCADGCVEADGTCYAVGDNWQIVTASQSFCQYKTCASAGKDRTTNYKCYYADTDVCMNLGQSISTGVCTAVECSVTDSGSIFREEVRNGCEDSQGTCQPVGASGFAATVEGVEQSSCSCTTYENDEGTTVYFTDCT